MRLLLIVMGLFVAVVASAETVLRYRKGDRKGAAVFLSAVVVFASMALGQVFKE